MRSSWHKSVKSWSDLSAQFLGAFQGGYKHPGMVGDLHGILQKHGEFLRKFMTTHRAVLDKCTRQEEARRAPGEPRSDSESDSGKKKEARKREANRVLAPEPGTPPTKKAKGTDAAPDPATGIWCLIHKSPSHNLQDFNKVKSRANDNRSGRREWKNPADGKSFNCGEPGHISRECPAKENAAAGVAAHHEARCCPKPRPSAAIPLLHRPATCCCSSSSPGSCCSSSTLHQVAATEGTVTPAITHDLFPFSNSCCSFSLG
ncbi:hypothetical protein BRADI_3g21771v3 [Brachypodium distachyon]|uniref:CCHC-type domain-containing protein n=1 Tax=Brachypodium distachyon TaxID=15368 RepID=A0A0Q3I6V5_BRADI|nr:hypothetical protein BRADI_3g21771v3 [Brachypodium distachyon]